MEMNGQLIDQSPIFIAGPPRSGTVMLAGLLYYHDIWIGRTRTTRYPGTNPELGVENLDIKNIMKREGFRVNYHNWAIPFPGSLLQHEHAVKREIETHVPQETRWLVKTSWTLTFFDFWNRAYPNALWIFPTRSPQAILDSMNRHPGMMKRPNHMKKEFIVALHACQREAKRVVKHSLFVDVKKIAQKDQKEIKTFFDFVNIPINKTKVDEWIQPERMKQ